MSIKPTCDVAGFSEDGDCGKEATHVIRASGEDGDVFFCKEHAAYYKKDFPDTLKKLRSDLCLSNQS